MSDVLKRASLAVLLAVFMLLVAWALAHCYVEIIVVLNLFSLCMCAWLLAGDVLSILNR